MKAFRAVPRNKLQVFEHREVRLADGSRRSVPCVGPVQLRFKTRAGYVGALVMGEQVLLGAIPVEDLDLIVKPGTRPVDVNPDSPNIASGICWLRMAWGVEKEGGDQLCVRETFRIYDGQIHAVEAFMRTFPIELRNGGRE